MPLWLDLLRTPMAAPETPQLRRARRTWQILCVATASSVLAIGPLSRVFGKGAALATLVLCVATLLHTVAYLRRKQKADNAYIEAVTGDVA